MTLLLSHCTSAQTPRPGTAGMAATTGSCPAAKREAMPRVMTCSLGASKEDPSIDNFDDGDLVLKPVERRVGSWYSFTDETAGCLSMQVENSGTSAALHLSGGGFTKWGAGFGTALAWSMADQSLCTYDVSAYAGVRFRARGKGTLRMNVTTREAAFKSAGGDCMDSEACFDQYGHSIALSREFQQIEIPFCLLTQAGFGAPLGAFDPRHATNVNFLIQSKGLFDVWLDDVEFIPWPEGKAQSCGVVCPRDELAAGIVPKPKETRLDQTTGIRLRTFDQKTKDCGPLTRRYLVHLPTALEKGTDVPVVIVLHGYGADAESMREFITQRRFETLADRDGFVVVYGNAAPGTGTVSDRPNGGGFHKNPKTAGQVDDFAYLRQIITDLSKDGLISGTNPVFLAGLSDGGGMTHMAAIHDPTRYRGIAELMPYPGPVVEIPVATGAFALKRVLLGFAIGDPGLPAGYDAQLAPVGSAWAAAMGLSQTDQRSPQTIVLPNRVDEGADYTGTALNALATRRSQATQIDYENAPSDARVRVIRFDHAGHLWPVPRPPDREPQVAEFGFRNQDMDMSDAVWDFFRSSLAMH
jgi:poly(3-hydroxybutyrate) depolymerase